VNSDGFSRRDFLRLTAGGAALLAAGAGCDSGAGTATSKSDAEASKGETLRIAKRTAYISGYDEWWDEQARRWGERNGVDVLVEHFDVNQAQAHAEAEAASQRGHDLFQLVASAAPFEDDVIDHRDVIEEVRAKFGNMAPFVERSVVNPKTGKYFAFADSWNASPVHYRTDLWDDVGRQPSGWDDLLTTGPALKTRGFPIGVGLGPDIESNIGLFGLLFAYGASIQDEDARVVVNSRVTVEAVKFATALFRTAMTDEVLAWDITSNNRYLVSGRGSLILNSIAALRALEAQDAGLAAKTGLRPVPAGPAGRFGPYAVNVFMIWKFSANQETAKRFLVDLVGDARASFVESQYLQIPAFPNAAGDLGELVANDPRANPSDKYRLLAGAAEWTTNIGYPGHTNAACEEVLDTSVISQMFAAAATGAMTAEEAVRTAEARINPIYDKWRDQGKI
jgi:multiple sugar transport system substrate-binding protein